VRAAISSASLSDPPCSRTESFTCSYCLARFEPFFTPRGGIAAPFGRCHRTRTPAGRRRKRARGFGRGPAWEYRQGSTRKGGPDVHQWRSPRTHRHRPAARLAALSD
jgi:hypothetical protein